MISDARLREADAGPWEGMTPREIAERWPGFLEAHRRPAGFETTESVVARERTDVCADPRAGSGGPRTGCDQPSRSPIQGSFARCAVISAPRTSRFPISVASGSTSVDDDLHLGPLFAIDGLAISGVDGPGEDPGEQADEPGDRGRAERGLAG